MDAAGGDHRGFGGGVRARGCGGAAGDGAVHTTARGEVKGGIRRESGGRESLEKTLFEDVFKSTDTTTVWLPLRLSHARIAGPFVRGFVVRRAVVQELLYADASTQGRFRP